MKKNILVLGAGGFIGGHLCRRLLDQGHSVVGVDIKQPEFDKTLVDRLKKFHLKDLTNPESFTEIFWQYNFPQIDEIYQLAADMGGAGYIFSKDHDADIMSNSANININLLEALTHFDPKFFPKVFYSSSACIYPERNQMNPQSPDCRESTAYPADPDSEYGWEKLFSERLFQSYARNYKIPVKIARFHNIFGERGSWNNGKEKAPAAMCRKVAETHLDGDTVEVWGDGLQTRSFLHVSDCLDAVQLLMDSEDFHGPVNIGSEEMISLNDLVKLVSKIAGKSPSIVHIPGPTGVRGRCSNNELIREKLGWTPKLDLEGGLRFTYPWIANQVQGHAEI